jgi:methyl-accepting chemotaxis protein
MRLSIKVRLAVVLATSTLGILGAIAGFSYLLGSAVSTYEAVVARNKAQSELGFRMVELAASTQNTTLKLVREIDLDAIESLVQQLDATNREIDALLAQSGAGAEGVRSPFAALAAANRKVRDALLAGEGAKAITIFVEQSTPDFQALLQSIRAQGLELQQKQDQQAAAARATLRATQTGVIVGVVLLMLLVIVLGAAMTRTISRALRAVVEQVRLVAAGDLRVSLAVAGQTDGEERTRDEIHELYRAFNDMLLNLRELQQRVAAAFRELEQAVGSVTGFAGELGSGATEQSLSVEEIAAFVQRMSEQAGEVARSMENLARGSEESSSSILQMMASIEQVAQNAEALSGSVEETSSSVVEVASSNRAVAQNIDSLNQMIAQASAAVTQIDASLKEVQTLAQDSRELSGRVKLSAEQEGGAAVQEASVQMGRIRQSIQSLAETVGKLSGSVGDIGDILVVIEDVAEQTNLLALNAAIIAAQAGEHGRGFAVVAEEIRELSERTAASTKEISRVIEGVRSESRSVDAMMREGVERVDVGVAAVNRTDQALKSIIGSSGQALEMSSRIAAATVEQASGSREAARSIQAVSERSAEISRATVEQTRGSESIVRAVEHMRDLAQQVGRATRDQAAGARQISKASVDSAALAQQVTRATHAGKELSERAVGEVAKIRASAGRTLTVVGRMKGIVESFTALAGHLKQTLSQFRT